MNREHLQETRANLGDWQDMWDKACEEGIFKPEPEEYRKDNDQPLAYDPQTCSMAGIEPCLLQENNPVHQPQALTEGRIPNPVYPDSVGRDDQGPKTAWVNEELLKELEGLKNKLFELENKFAAKSGDFIKQNAGDKKTMSQIESIRKQIDKVSNSLGIEDEPSPWVVKND